MSRLNSPKKNSSGAKQCDWHCTFLCIKNLKLVFFLQKVDLLEILGYQEAIAIASAQNLRCQLV